MHTGQARSRRIAFEALEARWLLTAGLAPFLDSWPLLAPARAADISDEVATVGSLEGIQSLDMIAELRRSVSKLHTRTDPQSACQQDVQVTANVSVNGVADGLLSQAGSGVRGELTVHTLDLASVWHNPLHPLDVNGDGVVAPIDVLLIINRLNARGAGPLPIGERVEAYLDTNRNGQLAPIDALLVINYLNRPDRDELPVLPSQPEGVHAGVLQLEQLGQGASLTLQGEGMLNALINVETRIEFSMSCGELARTHIVGSHIFFGITAEGAYEVQVQAATELSLAALQDYRDEVRALDELAGLFNPIIARAEMRVQADDYQLLFGSLSATVNSAVVTPDELLREDVRVSNVYGYGTAGNGSFAASVEAGSRILAGRLGEEAWYRAGLPAAQAEVQVAGESAVVDGELSVVVSQADDEQEERVPYFLNSAAGDLEPVRQTYSGEAWVAGDSELGRVLEELLDELTPTLGVIFGIES